MFFLAVDFDLDTNNLFLAGTGVAMRMQWRVKPSAIPQTTIIFFENDPVFPQSFNTFSDIWGLIFKRPVLKTGIFTIAGSPCDCPFQGDIEPDGFITAVDLGSCVDILFDGDPDVQEPACLTTRFDLDCDGFTTALDLSMITDHIFAGGPGPCDPCNQPSD
jgi:hypothetical protein